MNKKALTRRYILSFAIDYVILGAAIFPITLFISPDSAILFSPLIFALFFLYLVQDKLLRGASIGKRISSIEVKSVDSDGKLTYFQVLVRKICELVYILKIFFWNLRIDIDKISGTRIEFKNKKNTHEKKSTSNIKNKLKFYTFQIQKKRIKAFLYDSIFVLWAWILFLLYHIPSIHQFVVNISPNSGFWFEFLLTLLISLYYILKDLIFPRGSLGKRHFGIKIEDLEGKTPSKLQLFLRNFICWGFIPIEIVFFSLRAKGLCEYLSFTRIVEENS